MKKSPGLVASYYIATVFNMSRNLIEAVDDNDAWQRPADHHRASGPQRRRSVASAAAVERWPEKNFGSGCHAESIVDYKVRWSDCSFLLCETTQVRKTVPVWMLHFNDIVVKQGPGVTSL